MKRLLLGLGILLTFAAPSLAGNHHGCCADCGCRQGLRKVCRWVCEEVEEKVPCWDCECEDVVIPGKSPFCIQEVCPDSCQDCAPHGHARSHHKKIWGPPCECCVKTVKVLVRTEKTIKKKVWKPVIEAVCNTCCSNCTAGGPGGCADGAVPALDAAPPADPTIAPQNDPGAPPPPMPPASAGRETSLRRGFNALAPIFSPVSRKR